jgi:flagellar basal-body rod protein FlgC
MSLLTAIEISASGMTAQRQRFEVSVNNMANANVARPAGTEPFHRKMVVFSAAPVQTTFGAEFEDAIQGVEVSQVVTDSRPPRMQSEPGHPYADQNGMVAYPDINPMEELMDVLSATRSYEANLQVVTVAKDMAQKTLEILR